MNVTLEVTRYETELARRALAGVAEGLRSQAWADEDYQGQDITPDDLPALDALLEKLGT